MNRRNFLQQSAFATVGTMLIPSFLKAYETQAKGFLASSGALAGVSPTGKILVVVQLSGGNDGLNTVVPYRNDIYYRERPSIAIKPNQVLTLNDEVGLNPALAPLRALYDDGLLTVINNVGYPNPDRSHFRSMDIWQTASSADQYLQTGWVGRYLDAACAGQPGAASRPKAIEVDDTLSLSMKGRGQNALALLDPKKLYNQTRGNLVETLAAAQPDPHHGDVAYLYKTLAETTSSAAFVYNKTKAISRTQVTYPAHELGNRLKTVSELIQSGVDTQVYYISIGGFDTHINQPGQQERLLRQYGEAVDAFMQDIKAAGRMQDVLLMTFSEFGRRVKQNASNGTDHGTANNVFLLGGAGNRKVFNPAPTLTDLDEGDLRHSVDFRSIYATLLHDWLGTDDVAILGQQFNRLGLV